MPVKLNIAEFEPFTWVTEFTQPTLEIDETTYRQILHFSLIWNLFERHACGRFASIPRIKRAVHTAVFTNKVCAQMFAEHSAYFRNRAKNYGPSVAHYVRALNPHNSETRAILNDFFGSQSSSSKDEITGLLVIAYRIRNNLFHGEKDVAYLHTQAELFQVINSLLATYLTRTKCAA